MGAWQSSKLNAGCVFQKRPILAPSHPFQNHFEGGPHLFLPCSQAHGALSLAVRRLPLHQKNSQRFSQAKTRIRAP
jgi:hypothetical protein